MSTISAVGYSKKREAYEAAKEAAENALQSAGLTDCDLALLFSTVGYDQPVLIETIRSITKCSVLAGCSGEGIISFNFINESNTALAVMIIKSDEMDYFVEKVTGIKDNCDNAGKELAEALKPRLTENTMCLWLFADQLSINYDKFSNAFEKNLACDRHIPIFGGLSADNWQFKQTYQYCNDEICTDGVVCLVMNGHLKIASAITHGCTPIGTEREITKSEGNIIYEIDNRKVTDILQEYIPEEDIENWHKLGIRCLCIGLKAPGSLKGVYDEYIVRAMPVVDFKTGSGRIPTELKAGTKIHMISRNQEKLASNAEYMAQEIGKTLDGQKPKFVIQIDCAGRGKVLREDEKMLIQKKLQSFVTAGTPWLGLYCYGEMGPVAGKNYFHNFTVILAVFY